MSSREQYFLKINLVFLVLILALITWAAATGLHPELLFYPPATPPTPIASFLTHSFQMLCFIPPIVCSFSYYLLRSEKRLVERHKFLLFSAIVTGIFAINELYRIHIILLYFNIPKSFTISLYALGIIIYCLVFWQQIRQTSYQVLMIALALLTLAIAVDFLQLKNRNFASLSEGIPKLLSGLNLALYFWDICFQEIAAKMKSK
jgi:hypothetical protein